MRATEVLFAVCCGDHDGGFGGGGSVGGFAFLASRVRRWDRGGDGDVVEDVCVGGLGWFGLWL